MKELAELLQAVAALLWPILTFSALFLFRDPLRQLIHRLRKGKILGQEIELEAAQAAWSSRPLASVAVEERLKGNLSSPSFEDEIKNLVAESGRDEERLLPALVEVLKETAAKSFSQAFITIDSSPLLGARGRVWEEPVDDGLTVRAFLDRIWFEMRPFVRPFHYPDGWVLREVDTGRVYNELGREWAKRFGWTEDDRPLAEAGIHAGARLETIKGPKWAQVVVLDPLRQ